MKYENAHKVNLSLIIESDKKTEEKANEIIRYFNEALEDDAVIEKEG